MTGLLWLAGEAGVLASPLGAAGASVSTVKEREAGVGSTLPTRAFALTSNVCDPSLNVPVVWGGVQAPNGPPSTRHSKLAVPSGDEKPKVGVGSFVGPAGPE